MKLGNPECTRRRGPIPKAMRSCAGRHRGARSELSYASGQVLGGGDASNMSMRVEILVEDAKLEGELSVPREVRGIVLFAHGSGSSRHSPRNQYVAQVLRDAGMATLLFDLLTPEEDALDQRTAELRFNIALLANRLKQATEWVGESQKISDVKVGYFGASTGAAAALVAAAEPVREISAVVSRGGRPDLAGSALPKVTAPTLLIVGGADPQVLELNRGALGRLTCEKRLEVVSGATHLFEEAGTLEEVARLASHWFEQHMGRRGQWVQAA